MFYKHALSSTHQKCLELPYVVLITVKWNSGEEHPDPLSIQLCNTTSHCISVCNWDIETHLHNTFAKWCVNFLARQDECPGSLCSPSVGFSVGVCAWTKTLTLAITFKLLKIKLSYFICVFLMTRPFTWYHNFWPRDLDLEVWPTSEKL